jgi:small subunit ribosomal protein S21
MSEQSLKTSRAFLFQLKKDPMLQTIKKRRFGASAKVPVEGPYDLERAIRTLRKTLDEDGTWRAFSRHKFHEKPSERRRRKHAAAVRFREKRGIN